MIGMQVIKHFDDENNRYHIIDWDSLVDKILGWEHFGYPLDTQGVEVLDKIDMCEAIVSFNDFYAYHDYCKKHRGKYVIIHEDDFNNLYEYAYGILNVSHLDEKEPFYAEVYTSFGFRPVGEKVSFPIRVSSPNRFYTIEHYMIPWNRDTRGKEDSIFLEWLENEASGVVAEWTKKMLALKEELCCPISTVDTVNDYAYYLIKKAVEDGGKLLMIRMRYYDDANNLEKPFYVKGMQAIRDNINPDRLSQFAGIETIGGIYCNLVEGNRYAVYFGQSYYKPFTFSNYSNLQIMLNSYISKGFVFEVRES